MSYRLWWFLWTRTWSHLLLVGLLGNYLINMNHHIFKSFQLLGHYKNQLTSHIILSQISWRANNVTIHLVFKKSSKLPSDLHRHEFWHTQAKQVWIDIFQFWNFAPFLFWIYKRKRRENSKNLTFQTFDSDFVRFLKWSFSLNFGP